MTPMTDPTPRTVADDWLTCEMCGSTDDETTNGRELEDDEFAFVNLCDGCVYLLSKAMD